MRVLQRERETGRRKRLDMRVLQRERETGGERETRHEGIAIDDWLVIDT